MIKIVNGVEIELTPEEIIEQEQKIITSESEKVATEVTEKLERLKVINQEVLDLGGSNILIGIEAYDIKKANKITELTAEAEVIKTELETYDNSLVESIVDIIFA